MRPVLLCLLAFAVACHAQSHSQSDILLDIDFAKCCGRPDNWIRGTDVCSWDKVTCDGSGHVTEIDLHHESHFSADDNSKTILPDSFGQLISLTTLDLSRIDLDKLPESFGNLTSLTTQDLSDNIR